MSILAEIFAHKRAEVAACRRRRPLAAMQAAAAAATPPLDLAATLRQAAFHPALIAEVKRASPSRGLLAPDFDHLALARAYVAHGATAISVLTDSHYFQGHLDFLSQIAALTPRVPLLRKDFLLDPYQLYEARAAGADAVLLIVAGLAPDRLRDLHAEALALGMTPLVEVHTRAELDVALTCEPRLVGINNRDLHTFTVDLETTLALRPLIPNQVAVVAESGIHRAADVARLASAGVDAMLVGESLVTAPEPGRRVADLVQAAAAAADSRQDAGAN